MVTIALIGGCVSLLDIDRFTAVDEPPEGGADVSNASETGVDDGGVDLPDAKPTCNAPSTCRKAPPGFDGPFVVLLRAGTSCPAPFLRSWERAGEIGGADPKPPPATCTCACGPLTGNCLFRIQEYLDDDCTGSVTSRILAPGVCYVTRDEADDFRPQVQATGSCAPDASTTVAPLDAGTLAIGCSPTVPAGCDDGICVPPPPADSRICVRPSGDSVTCPVEYPSKIDLPAGVEDTRGCTPCTCAASPSCTFQYKLYDSDDCTGTAPTLTDSNCHTENGIDSVKLLTTNVTGSCAPNGGAPTGDVAVTSVSALCCLP